MSKEPGKHSREERLKQIAEIELAGAPAEAEEEGAENVDAPEASEPTMAATAVMEPASQEAPETPVAPIGSQSDDAPFQIDDSSIAAFSPENYIGIPTRRSHGALKAFGITIGVVVGLLLVAYIVGVVVFMGRFLPNTTIEQLDVSMKPDVEVASMLDDIVESYEVSVSGNGFKYKASGPDVDLALDSQKIVADMHQDLNAWLWPMLILEPSHDESAYLTTTFDKKKCNKAAKKAVKEFNKTAQAPVNAKVVYDESSETYTVKEEEEGTQLDAKAVLKSLDEAVSQLDSTVELSYDHLLKPEVLSTDQKLVDSAEFATGLVSAKLTLNMNGETVQEIDGSQLSQYVKIDDKYNVTLDEDALNAWVRDVANSFDTIGSTRTFTRADGKEITVGGGVYGWEVDTAQVKELVLEAVKAGEKTTIDIPCISTAAVFNGRGQRDWGNRYIDVDISEQHVTYYGDDGKVIWEADCITGSPDGKHDTGLGVWVVNGKESPSTLIGYTESGKKEYETEVEYWMPFEYNGIGFHDATWQPDFGGSMYAEGYGSHGCVNLSASAAESLYEIIQVGDVVVVHN